MSTTTLKRHRRRSCPHASAPNGSGGRSTPFSPSWSLAIALVADWGQIQQQFFRPT